MEGINLDAQLHRTGTTPRGGDKSLLVAVSVSGDYGHTDEQWEFIQAMYEYKKINKRPFPTWTEALWVLKKLGYHK